MNTLKAVLAHYRGLRLQDADKITAEDVRAAEARLLDVERRFQSGEHVTDEELSFLEDVLEAERKILSEI
ncbi:hypothetical protein OB953_20765 [Aeromonas salmonicida]|uniref:hypothetical protein n=1 Tax=Aeromonas salmonicida TaxID=645 RepID=UPI00259F00DD|nr:hypothetical protein [Aeromonas salmonicida]MDM5138009.1 hypothetical protein [Aeromonas salmonicida]